MSGKLEQVAYVLEQGVLQPFCDLLSIEDPQIMVVVLDGISNILKMASNNYDDLASITAQIEECNGLDLIEHLQSHRNEEIYRLAFDIIDKYFSEEVTFYFCCNNILNFLSYRLIFFLFKDNEQATNISENQNTYTFDVQTPPESGPGSNNMPSNKFEF